MELLLGTVCVCLLVILTVLLWKYVSLKKNIRHFSQELEKLKNSDYRQPVKVTDFDKDLVELALKVNEHTDIQRQLGVKYEERQKQLGTFISGISHDFRTPLTASLSNLLTETVLEQHSWIADKNIATDFEISDGIMIQADVHCLTRILNNLMSNAQKYTSDSFGVKLKQDGDCVVLCVSNTIADSTSLDVDRVFEPFYRMDARTAGGSGLGLYVVKLLCDRFGWSVKADLNDNVFTVSIFP